MYYEDIHKMVRDAAAAEKISITALLKLYGMSKMTYYRRLKSGSSWKTSEIKILADITGKSTAEILEEIL